MADNDSLLDVFVNVQPHPDSVNALKDHLHQVVADATRSFNMLGEQANAIARRADYVRHGGGRGGGRPSGPSTEEQQAQQAQQQFASLRRQLSQDIANLRTQLSGLNAKGLITELNAAQVAIRSIGEQVVNLDAVGVGGRQAQLEIEQRTEQLLQMRRVLESIQERAPTQILAPGAGIAEAVDRARQQTQQLQKELQIARAELREAEAPNLVQDLNRADIELKQILFDLSELNNAAQGPVFMQGFLDRINQVQSEITTTRGLTQEAIQNELRGRDQVADALDHQARLQIRIQELERSSGAIPAQQKQDIARLKAAIAEANYELRRQQSEINGTQQSWYNYLLAINNVTNAQENLVNEFQNIKTAGGVSFNTLGNNMYQLGQAFEDAAIGYQLNGIAGAVRGASNNVSFLLNNLSQVPSVQKAIADRFGIMEKKAAVLLPGIAAFAGVLGITVLPAMAEWLASLDDIEYQLDDLSDLLSRQFSNIDLEIDVKIDEGEFSRSISRMNSVREILEEISRLKETSEDIAFKVSTQIEDIAQGDVSTRLRSQLQQFRRDLVPVLEQLRDERDVLLGLQKTSPFDLGFMPTPKESSFEARSLQFGITAIQDVSKLLQAIDADIDDISDKSRQGIFDSKQIQVTVDQLDQVKKSLEDNQVLFTNSSEITFEDANASIQSLANRLNELVEPARRFESIVTEQLEKSVFAVTLKTEQLAARQQLFREELAGTASEYDVLLLDVSELSRTYEDLIRSNLDFYKSVGKSAEELERFKSVLTEEARLQTENALLEDQQEIIDKLRTAEEKLDQLRSRKQSDKSRRTSLEQFTTALQEAALSIGTEGLEKNTQAMERLTEEVDRLRDALQKIEAAQDIVASGGGSAQLRDLSLAPAMRARIPGMVAAGFGGPIGGIANAMQLFGGDVNQTVLGNRSRFQFPAFETMPIRGVDPTQERMLESVDGLRKDINRIAERQEMKQKMTEGSNWKAAVGP